MNTQKYVFTAALFLAASTATPALASDFDPADLKPYVGMDFSYLNANWESAPNGVEGSRFISEELVGANPYIGVQVHDNVGIEVGYLETGRSEKNFNGAILGGVGPASTDTKISGFHLDAIGSYNVTPKFEALGTVGVARFEADIDVTNIVGTQNVDETDNAWRIGAGGHYALTDNFGVRSIVRYNLVDFSDNTGDSADGFWQANVGVQYRF